MSTLFLAMRFPAITIRVAGLLLSFFVATDTQANDELLIQTTNGRLLHGALDVRTDADFLWIRQTEGNIILASSVKWSDVASAELAGSSITAAQLAERREELVTAAPASFLTEFEPSEVSAPATPLVHFRSRPSITSIEIEATLANLDRTVESDGLWLAIAALDETRIAHAIRGSLTARLIVERLNYHTGEVTFEDFGRWTHHVSKEDFKEGVAELPLRFRRASPEFDWELCTAALLNVRLNVYGVGNFEASIPIAIHELNPIRDELRNWQGSRFFRNELTRNTRQDGTRLLHQGYTAP